MPRLLRRREFSAIHGDVIKRPAADQDNDNSSWIPFAPSDPRVPLRTNEQRRTGTAEMGRQKSIARSVAAPLRPGGNKRRPSRIGRILAAFAALFSLYQLPLEKVRPEVFEHLRRNCWQVDDGDYAAAFEPSGEDEDGEGSETALHSIGDMGFSGSVRVLGISKLRIKSYLTPVLQTFYSTSSQQYLVKSVPRYSEHSFFTNDLLDPYAKHMESHPGSLLVRIVDFLASPAISIGRTLRLAPSHHIVMENILYGQDKAKDNWEHWDLKPTSYFYPERDIASGRLTSEATKSQLADEFHDKIRLTRRQADELFAALEADTALLAAHNAVDYSLFLVRIKTERPPKAVARPGTRAWAAEDVVPADPPSAPPGPPSWRTGIPSPDGEHIFRASVLDFFWAKHKLQPLFMTALVRLWNAVVSNQGPMSITTTSEEYRQRFLRLCRGIVDVVEPDEGRR